MREIDQFYLNQDEPNKSCFLALRTIILNHSPELLPALKYGLPCFMLGKKIFCYLWQDKKTKQPYIAINGGVEMNHPDLVVGDRKIYALLPIDPSKDIPVEKIHELLSIAKLLPRHIGK
jgi:hypothetical protein